MKTKIFFIWGAACTICVLFSYFLVLETKGLSLEQVDRMLETTPRTSKKWVSHHMRGDASSLDTHEKVYGREPVAHREY